jgi:hypothetical protein
MFAMAADRSRGSRLDEEHARFILGGVSVIVASRDAALVPDVVRGCGCRVSRDRRRVTVLVEMVAVVFSQPSTHLTIQLKGTDARAVRVTRSDHAIAAAHRAAWVDDLCRIGYSRDFAEAFWGRPPRDLGAIAFTPSAAFQQTPGPAAGQPLERRA